MTYDIRELHDMIVDALREGILSAYKEINMGNMGGTTEDTFENAKAYCVRLKSRFAKYPKSGATVSARELVWRVQDFLELAREMKQLLTEEECKYVVTHLHSVVGREFSTQADDFISAYLTI